MTTESTGVYETGLKYRLENYTMSSTYPIGVSNEFTGKPAEISVNEGILLIVYTMEAMEV